MFRYFISLSLVIIFWGCSYATPPLSEVLKYEQKAAILPKTSTVPKVELKELRENFLQKYFAPWSTQKLWGSEADVIWAFNALKNNSKYVGENLARIDNLWLENIKKIANTQGYGSVLSYAITTKNTNLRIFPTNKPLFANSNEKLDYPFDFLQNSFLSAMQPILVSHYSEDLTWAFVQSSFASGWIRSNELAIIDEKLIQKIKNAGKIVITKDSAPIYYERGVFAQHLKVGTILPLLSQDDYGYKTFIITSDESGNGVISNITVSREHAGLFPMEFNSINIQKITDELLNENYGWGGLYENRDCSAFTKDFLSIFGVWLPRNSALQKNVGLYFDVSNLKPKEKEEKLLEFGVPYLTLVYMPGHIMLYAGKIGGKAIILHNIWGLKTKDNGRYIIGKSVISDLYLAQNVQNINTPSLLINRIIGFTVIAPKNARDKAKIFTTYKDYIASVKNDLFYFKSGSKLIFDDKAEKSYQDKRNKADIQDQLFEIYIKGELEEPQNDAGRIRNEEFFKAIYGANQTEVEKNLISVTWLPSSVNATLLFNKNNKAAEALQAVSNELDKLPNEYFDFLNNIGGTYNYRNVLETDKLSMHAFGIAIDLNTNKSNYWLWDGGYETYRNSIPQVIVDIFEKHKFIWGGKWRHYDTMHFEYRPELF